MAIFDGNLVLSFAAQYKAEDTAAYLLYEIDRKTLSEKAVSGDQLCKFFGVDVKVDEYSYGELCFVAYDPQLLYACDGRRIYLNKPSLVIERAVSLDANLYNYVTILGLCSYLVEKASSMQKTSEQLSFGFGETVSMLNRRITAFDLNVYNSLDAKLSDCDNFAMCLALPKNRFKNVTNSILAELDINRSGLNGKNLEYVIEQLRIKFNVPSFVIAKRLKKLGYV